MRKGRDFLLKTLKRYFCSSQTHCKMRHSSDRYSYKPTLQWNPQVEDYFIKAYGADHFSRISQSLTRPSCYSCIRVNTLKSTSDGIIEKLTAILQGKTVKSGSDCTSVGESNASAEVGPSKKLGNFHEEPSLDSVSNPNGTLPMGLLRDEDALKEKSQSASISKCQLPGLDHVLFIKGSGPHTIEYGDVPNQSLKEVIVSRKCAEAVLRGAQVFVPGVLACSSHVEKGDTVAVSVAVEKPSSDGGWNFGFTRGTVLQGLETDPQYLERNGVYIGQGNAMMSRAGIFRASHGIAIEMTNRVFNLPSFHDVLEGEIFLQNLPSIITAHVLDPQQGERILDMCAAPGGKTTAIAILMRDKGEVVAVDRSHNKVMDIQKLAAEMGLNCITAYRLDALKAVARVNGSADPVIPTRDEDSLVVSVNDSGQLGFPVEVCDEKANKNVYLSKADIRKSMRRMRNGPGRNQSMGGRVENSKGFSRDSFDRVLLDAPCSALGLRPRLFSGEETLDSLRNHGKYQKRMFDQAVQLVRPGGVIVYSTCTINPGENEALVRYALDTYKFLSLAPQHPRVGGPGLVGRCELFDGKYVEEWLKHGEEELVQRFDPSSPLDTIGFFIAKFNVGQKEP